VREPREGPGDAVVPSRSSLAIRHSLFDILRAVECRVGAPHPRCRFIIQYSLFDILRAVAVPARRAELISSHVARTEDPPAVMADPRKGRAVAVQARRAELISSHGRKPVESGRPHLKFVFRSSPGGATERRSCAPPGLKLEREIGRVASLFVPRARAPWLEISLAPPGRRSVSPIVSHWPAG